jgi:polysaccharide biosynthesis transport protein
MENSGTAARGQRQRASTGIPGQSQFSVSHYLHLIFHRWWLVAIVFVLVTVITFFMTSRMPDIYVSETVIMVDPQKVPEAYVRSTVTGDVRNRLGTLSQQILSATRLQKIIDTLNLYPDERKSMAREDVIGRMRRDISVGILSEFGSGQEMQAFRIGYSGREPRLVAQVTNELASLFIEENLKAREQQATGTTEFLQNQLQEARKTLESQEAQLKDFKLKHIGEMPEHQAASLQIVGQLQSQLQLESEALNRAEQQKSYIEAMTASQSNARAVDMDAYEPKAVSKAPQTQTAKPSPVAAARARLAALEGRYGDEHPEIRRLRRQIQDEETKLANDQQADVNQESATTAAADAPSTAALPAAGAKRSPSLSATYFNPVLASQMRALDSEISKRREEQQRLSKQVAKYQARLEAIPLRDQQITELVRDYEITKAHYKQLLEKQMSAETATQLEIRQKGERFSVLDPAQPAERPSRPQRFLLNVGGSLGGLVLGLVLALVTEVLGISITAPEQITAVSGLPVLEVIPVIRTHVDKVRRRRRLLLATASAGLVAFGGCAVLLYHYRDRVF